MSELDTVKIPDPEVFSQLATHLQNWASQHQDYIQQLDAGHSNLKESWQGDGANTYSQLHVRTQTVGDKQQEHKQDAASKFNHASTMMATALSLFHQAAKDEKAAIEASAVAVAAAATAAGLLLVPVAGEIAAAAAAAAAATAAALAAAAAAAVYAVFEAVKGIIEFLGGVFTALAAGLVAIGEWIIGLFGGGGGTGGGSGDGHGGGGDGNGGGDDGNGGDPGGNNPGDGNGPHRTAQVRDPQGNLINVNYQVLSPRDLMRLYLQQPGQTFWDTQELGPYLDTDAQWEMVQGFVPAAFTRTSDGAIFINQDQVNAMAAARGVDPAVLERSIVQHEAMHQFSFNHQGLSANGGVLSDQNLNFSFDEAATEYFAMRHLSQGEQNTYRQVTNYRNGDRRLVDTINQMIGDGFFNEQTLYDAYVNGDPTAIAQIRAHTNEIEAILRNYNR